ncbi:hypothetical protein OHB24_27165 [Kribbella sp. NBC_00482]|uniref:hypothetical protein n=1 Tax=Kribbella sp. NBC_00482 TaxID=2975968 RepID=UPI002E17EFD8
MAAATEVPTYRVTAPYVMVKCAGSVLPGGNGYMAIGLYRDSLIPASVAPGEVERLLSGGFVEVVPVAAEVA